MAKIAPKIRPSPPQPPSPNNEERGENGYRSYSTSFPLLFAPESLELAQLPTERGMVDSTLLGGKWMETILVARLEWLWPQICGGQAQIDGIKIDVQGMEIETLRGKPTALFQA